MGAAPSCGGRTYNAVQDTNQLAKFFVTLLYGKGVIRSTWFCRASWSVLLLRLVWVASWGFSVMLRKATNQASPATETCMKLRIKALELQGEVAGSPVELPSVQNAGLACSECSGDEVALLESRPLPSLYPKACPISSRWSQGPSAQARAKRQIFSLVPS
eukprot:s356_g9.t1